MRIYKVSFVYNHINGNHTMFLHTKTKLGARMLFNKTHINTKITKIEKMRKKG